MTVTINPNEVAAALAHKESGTQATFFSLFLVELEKTCETHFRLETQMIHISENLSDKHRELLAILAPTKEV